MVEHSDYVFAANSLPDGRLVGFARVLTDRVFKALVFDVIVAPDHRADGIGRGLMEQIVGHSDLRKVAHLELYCLPEMAPFYERWGFSTDVSGLQLMRRRVG
jgi:GNAT superfamily N-acetyltransferase